ncbi:MAG: DUF3426 domain-containing protein [Geminicoccaceae bacterium]
MIITCPSCATRYTIPPESLGAEGRMVRCTACGHRWFVGHEPPAPAEPEVPPPPLDDAPPLPPATEARPGQQPAGSTGATVGWLGVLLVLLILTGLVLGRNEVVALVPEAGPIYQRMGLPVTREIGLELRGVVSERLDEADSGATGERDRLRIAGDVVNVSGTERSVPPVRVALLDAARDEIAVHLVEVPQKTLADGDSTRFELLLDDPPEAASNFSVTFDVPGK